MTKDPDKMSERELRAEVKRLRDDVDHYQQMLDEIVVALGSLGLSHSEIIDQIRELRNTNDELHAEAMFFDDKLIEVARLRLELEIENNCLRDIVDLERPRND